MTLLWPNTKNFAVLSEATKTFESGRSNFGLTIGIAKVANNLDKKITVADSVINVMQRTESVALNLAKCLIPNDDKGSDKWFESSIAYITKYDAFLDAKSAGYELNDAPSQEAIPVLNNDIELSQEEILKELEHKADCAISRIEFIVGLLSLYSKKHFYSGRATIMVDAGWRNQIDAETLIKSIVVFFDLAKQVWNSRRDPFALDTLSKQAFIDKSGAEAFLDLDTGHKS